jgi:hypothetical protein
MNKTILTFLVFCFVAFSAGAQVENKKTNTDARKANVEQSKIQSEKAQDPRAEVASVKAENPNAPVIKFDRMVHDYGTLEYDSDGKCEFKFTNEGKEPLILTNVKAS